MLPVVVPTTPAHFWGSNAFVACPRMLVVHSSKLFWPSDRKLFRHRSRVRLLVPALAVALLIFLALAMGYSGVS